MSKEPSKAAEGVELENSTPELEDAPESELEHLTRERDELLETTRRVQADFENYRKRARREQSEAKEHAVVQVVEQLLGLLDNFDLALANLDETPEHEKIRKGLELLYAEFWSVLERHGVSKIDAQGQMFDPELHDAVVHEDGDGEAIVTEVMRDGYKMHNRVIRPAMVKVSR